MLSADSKNPLRVPGLDYVTVDRVIKAPIARSFLTSLPFTHPLLTFSWFSMSRLLRAQRSEVEVSFFTGIEETIIYEVRNGIVTLTNLRIIWYNSDNAENNLCFKFSYLLFVMQLILLSLLLCSCTVIFAAFGYNTIFEVTEPSPYESSHEFVQVLLLLIFFSVFICLLFYGR
jgi:hypothetical protein